MKIVKISIISIFCLLLILAGGFYVWTQFYYEATEDALAFVNEQEGPYLVFGDESATTGVVFYQGAKVEAAAYSYLGAELAKEGYFVVIPQLPLNLAILGFNEAQSIMEQYDQVENWYLGGHSLGGAMASRFAYLNEQLVEGIIYLASYPADDFSQSNIPKLSIYGEVDQIATLETMETKRELFSPNTTWSMIEGGNHANFGMYGPQKGDNEGLMPASEQRDETVATILNWLDQQQN